MGVVVGLGDVFADFAALRAAGFAGIACAKPTVMLAMTPRTGSTHLCVALHQAGQSVEPTEIFNPRGVARRESELRNVSRFADYIASFAADPDAAFIFKTGWHDAAPLAPYITRLFPNMRVVFIDRRNIAAQAVSVLRGEVLNLWHRRPGEPRSVVDAEGKFDLQRLLQIVANLEREKQGWAGWFAASNIQPAVRLRYEDFMDDVNKALRLIVPALQLPLRTDLPPGAGLEKLADAVSADWTERLQKKLLNMS